MLPILGWVKSYQRDSVPISHGTFTLIIHCRIPSRSGTSHWSADQVMCLPMRRQAYLAFQTVYCHPPQQVGLPLFAFLSRLPVRRCHFHCFPHHQSTFPSVMRRLPNIYPLGLRRIRGVLSPCHSRWCMVDSISGWSRYVVFWDNPLVSEEKVAVLSQNVYRHSAVCHTLKVVQLCICR